MTTLKSKDVESRDTKEMRQEVHRLEELIASSKALVARIDAFLLKGQAGRKELVPEGTIQTTTEHDPRDESLPDS